MLLSAVLEIQLRMQKKAYRRANGGSAAPTIQDDVRPRLVQREREELRVLSQRLELSH